MPKPLPAGYTILIDPDGNEGVVREAHVDKYLERTERVAGDGRKCVDPAWKRPKKGAKK